MYYIGDVHAGKRNGRHFHWYLALANRLTRNGEQSIQLGDLGYAYHGSPFDIQKIPASPFQKLIRGNHDDPAAHRSHPNYLGDFGVWENHFFVSGARSIDQEGRTIGISWWPDEQLSYRQWCECLDLYRTVRPSIVVSHEAPMTVVKHWWNIDEHDGTKMGLESMLEIHQPDLWVFGHHHKSKRGFLELKKRRIKTYFVALAEMEIVSLST